MIIRQIKIIHLSSDFIIFVLGVVLNYNIRDKNAISRCLFNLNRIAQTPYPLGCFILHLHLQINFIIKPSVPLGKLTKMCDFRQFRSYLDPDPDI